MKVYRGFGGLSLKVPVSNAQIFRCFANWFLISKIMVC